MEDKRRLKNTDGDLSILVFKPTKDVKISVGQNRKAAKMDIVSLTSSTSAEEILQKIQEMIESAQNEKGEYIFDKREDDDVYIPIKVGYNENGEPVEEGFFAVRNTQEEHNRAINIIIEKVGIDQAIDLRPTFIPAPSHPKEIEGFIIDKDNKPLIKGRDVAAFMKIIIDDKEIMAVFKLKKDVLTAFKYKS